MRRKSSFAHIRDLIVLSLFAAIMVSSDIMMNSLPNVHLIAMFTILLTRFYRKKALIAVYLFVLLDGLIEGFFISTWIMYAYIWAILWFWVMLLPKELSVKKQAVIYPILGGLHGITFGLFTAPPGYLMVIPPASRSFSGFCLYVLSGLSFDIAHMIGNIFACTLVLPLLTLMTELRKKNKL